MTPSPEQAQQFRERGYILLPGAVPSSRLRPVHDELVEQLRRLGLASSGRGAPKALRGLPAFQQIARLSATLKLPNLVSRLVAPELRALVDALGPRQEKLTQEQLLVSPPHQGEWTLDALNWHTDVAPNGDDVPACVQAFILLADLGARGGATLLLAGSHRLAADRRLASWMRETLRKGQGGLAELGERGLSLVELTGQAGDVYLVDMRTLHTPSINASGRPRLVATVRFLAG